MKTYFGVATLYLLMCSSSVFAQEQDAEATGDVSELSDSEQSELLFESHDPRAAQGVFIGTRGINPGWKNRWVAERSPNIYGQTGLFRINSARAGKASYFDIGIHARTFFADDFILPGIDSNTFADQSITFGFTLWDALEIGVATRAASNENSLLTPRVTFAVGDFAGSAKYSFDLDPIIIGFDARAFLPAGSDRVGIAFEQLSLTGMALATIDFYQSTDLPLRIHLNGGYAFQNTNRNFELNEIHLDNASHFVTLTTNQWYYDQFVYGVGLEVLLPFVAPFIELYSRTPLNTGRDLNYFDESMITLTPGARLTVGRGLHIDLGMDLGLGGITAINGQPINPQWAAQLALAYTFSPFVAETQVEIREKESSMGRISGCVIDNETSIAVQESYVEFVNTDLPRIVVDDNACFSSPLLKAGEQVIRIRHPEYKMGQTTVKVIAQKNEQYQFPIAAAPRFGKFYGTVTNFEDKPITASLTAEDKKGNQIQFHAAEGSYETSLRPGTYQIFVSAKGYFKKGARIRIEPNGNTIDHFVLREIPNERLTRLTDDSIEIMQVIPFEFNKSRLLRTAGLILDDVVDVILSHPKIKKIEIEGHTDNTGNEDYNMELSKRRAEAVRDYLVATGIPKEKLVAKGYGTSKPIADNQTASGRAKNRRVDFVILDRGQNDSNE